MLALYGHLFSSYTWKALIPLYANGIAFEFRSVEEPVHAAAIQEVGPQGKFPVLADGDQMIFEATTIIEHLALNHGARDLVPADPAAAIRVRQLDRVFDNYVMNQMQPVVDEYIRSAGNPDMERVEQIRAKLPRSYAWIERWLETYPHHDAVTLIECAAAPSLFYADWVVRIEAEKFPRLAKWRAHLLALPAVERCVDDARPFRHYFPLGAPDRD